MLFQNSYFIYKFTMSAKVVGDRRPDVPPDDSRSHAVIVIPKGFPMTKRILHGQLLIRKLRINFIKKFQLLIVNLVVGYSIIARRTKIRGQKILCINC